MNGRRRNCAIVSAAWASTIGWCRTTSATPVPSCSPPAMLEMRPSRVNTSYNSCGLRSGFAQYARRASKIERGVKLWTWSPKTMWSRPARRARRIPMVVLLSGAYAVQSRPTRTAGRGRRFAGPSWMRTPPAVMALRIVRTRRRRHQCRIARISLNVFCGPDFRPGRSGSSSFRGLHGYGLRPKSTMVVWPVVGTVMVNRYAAEGSVSDWAARSAGHPSRRGCLTHGLHAAQ
jgi:hypothetical protein